MIKSDVGTDLDGPGHQQFEHMPTKVHLLICTSFRLLVQRLQPMR